MYLRAASLFIAMLLVSAASALHGAEQGGMDAAELCRSLIPNLDDRLAQLDSHTVTYAYVSYGPRPGEAPTFDLPADAEAPDRVELIKVATVYRSGPAYRIHEQTIWTRRGQDEADSIATFTSDGSQFDTRFANAKGGRSTLMLDLSDEMHRVSAEMDAYGWRVLGQVAPLDYQQYMRWGAESADLRLVSESDHQAVVQWRFVPDLPQTQITMTIDELRKELVAIQMDAHDSDAASPDARVVLRKTVQFREHQVGSTTLLGARVSDQLGDAGEDWPAAWSVVIVTPIAIEATPRERGQILLRPRQNELVQDSRFDIAYPVGESRINLDGLVVGVQEPVDSDVGWDLDQWVRDLPALARASVSIPARTEATPDKASVTTFDAGSVLVEGSEPATAEHRFIIHNDTEKSWEVKDVAKSCGCLTCDISTKSIPPGADAVLEMAMTVPSPGERRQEVAVVFEDGTMRKFELRALGYSPGRLRVMCSGFTEEKGVWQAEVRAYWVESEPRVLSEVAPPLTLESRDGARLQFSGWTLIEPASADRLRPRKLFGRGIVRLAHRPTDGNGADGRLTFHAGDSRSFSFPIMTFGPAEGRHPAEGAVLPR